MLAPLPPPFPATRDALHAVAEHVLAPARHRVDGHIGLRVTIGGFGTPEFGDGEVVRIEGTEIVVERAGTERRAPVTTLRAAAEFVGVPVGADTSEYPPTTEAEPDALLPIDPAAAAALAEWYAFARHAPGRDLRAASGRGTRDRGSCGPSTSISRSTSVDEEGGTRANYGASPGDETIAEPYLYVGPWDAARKAGSLAEYPFGAARPYSALHGRHRSRARRHSRSSSRVRELVLAGPG